MQLELKDVESSVVYTVDPSGAVLGRERARTDISFRDESISKRHARIYASEGAWFIEDLGSSNGTYVEEQRITEPVPLGEGVTFALAQRRFEVVEITGAGVAPSSGDTTFGDIPDDMVEAELKAVPPTPGISALLRTGPRALAFFLAAVPWMAIQPARTLRRSIYENPAEAMSRGELAVYGCLALGMASLVAPLLSALAQLRAGISGPQLDLTLLVSVLLAAVVGAASGLLLHPALGWLVRVAGGLSHAQYRTNFALNAYTFALLGALPIGVGQVLSAVRVPYFDVWSIGLGLAVSLLGVYILHQWAVAFRVGRVIRYAIIGVGGVSAVAALATAIPRVTKGLSGDAAPVAAVDSDLVAMREKAMARAAAAEPHPALSNDPTPPPRPEAEPKRGASEKPSSGLILSQTAGKESRTPQSQGSLSVAASRIAERPRGQTDYLTFRLKREAIERAVEDNPGLLNQKEVLDDYAPMWRLTYEIRDKWKSLMRSKPAWEREKLLRRKREYEVFRRTRMYAERLHGKLFDEQDDDAQTAETQPTRARSRAP